MAKPLDARGKLIESIAEKIDIPVNCVHWTLEVDYRSGAVHVTSKRLMKESEEDDSE